MANVRSKEQNFTIEYIRLYRELPELWNVKSKEYHDRYKKKTAYDILLRKYREFYIDATMEDLKKKLNALRTNYRKELRKYIKNKEHKPSLWYFGEMCFINNIDFSQDDVDDSNENTQFTIEYVEEDDETLFDTESSSMLDNPENSQCYKDLPTPQKKLASQKVNSEDHYQSECVNNKKNRNYYHENDQYVKDFSIPSSKKITTPKSINEEPYPSLKRDEYFHWAMACAADLRTMERTQQVYAKKAVAEILMEGQLGTLTRDSVKVNHHMNNSVSVKIGSPSSIYENNPLLLQNEPE